MAPSQVSGGVWGGALTRYPSPRPGGGSAGGNYLLVSLPPGSRACGVRIYSGSGQVYYGAEWCCRHPRVYAHPKHRFLFLENVG